MIWGTYESAAAKKIREKMPIIERLDKEAEMSQRIYVLTEEGEPIHAFTDLQKIRFYCEDYLSRDKNEQQWFQEYIDDEEIPFTTEKEREEAWQTYVNDIFENGTWGDYAQYESWLD